jgi:hypothetical protein
MKWYLTLLRRNGRRLGENELAQPPRMVMVRMTMVSRFRHIEATCCIGGGVVGQLWEPCLTALNDQHMLLQGFEQVGGAGVVQEWQMTPHG